MNDKTKSKPGPQEDRIKLNIDWEDAVGKALEKKRPKDGWPDEDKKKDKGPK